MRTFRFCMAGFGNVGKRLLRLLEEKSSYLAHEWGCEFVLTGVSTPSRGTLLCDAGLPVDELFDMDTRLGRFDPASAHFAACDTLSMIERAHADVFIELSTLSIKDGEPATSYILRAFERGMHVVTANKGPEAWRFDDLAAAARHAGREFLYETTVMDGTPIFNLMRETLHGNELLGIRGILNGTSNFVLHQLENGRTLEQAIQEAQRLQFAEADPSLDLDGWDGAAKICAMANALMGARQNPTQVTRRSIADVTAEELQAAKREGCAIKYICRAERDAPGGPVALSVLPEKIPLDDAFACVNGASAAVTLRTDLAGELTIIQADPSILQTAYGVYSDLITLAKRTGNTIH